MHFFSSSFGPTVPQLGLGCKRRLTYFIFLLYYHYIYQTLSLSYYYQNHTYHCHYYQDQKTTSPSSALPAHSCGPPAVLVTPQFLSPIPGSLYPQCPHALYYVYLYQAIPGSLYLQCPHALNHSLTAVPQSIVGPHPNPNHSLLCFMALWYCTTNTHKLISWDETVLNIPSTMFASSSVD